MIADLALKFLKQGVCKATADRFSLAQRNFLDFDALVLRSRDSTGSYAVPDEVDLVLFATWLACSRKLSPAVVKQRLTAVGQWCSQQGFGDPRLDGVGRLRPYLYSCLRGIARTRSTKARIREALTTDKLRRLIDTLWGRDDLPWSDRLCLAATLCVGVFGLFRCGELTTGKTDAFNGEDDLRACDVSVGTDMAQDKFVDITLRKSKTDVERRGVTLRIYASGQDLCPVTLLEHYLCARETLGAQPDEPLFVLRSGKYLTRNRLNKVIKDLAREAGYDATHFTTHSMRAGGATSMAMLGYSNSTIQQFGRWASDAYTSYITVSATARKGVAARMAQLQEIDDRRRRELWLEVREAI